MNRLFLVRHGGSTANEDNSFYQYNDSAICLTTNGIRQALASAGVLAEEGPLWLKPGNFDLEVFASEYTRAQQTARIALDQMGLLSVQPQIRAVINERNYGTAYLSVMDSDPTFDGNDSESSVRARVRVRAFLAEIEPLLERADVLAFSHMGTMRALIAEILHLTDQDMMKTVIDNGAIFGFKRISKAGQATYVRVALPDPVIPKNAPKITEPPVAPPPNSQWSQMRRTK